MIKLGGFNISFYVTKLYDDKIEHIMEESYAEDGIMTMPISAIGYKAYVSEPNFIDDFFEYEKKYTQKINLKV